MEIKKIVHTKIPKQIWNFFNVLSRLQVSWVRIPTLNSIRRLEWLCLYFLCQIVSRYKIENTELLLVYFWTICDLKCTFKIVNKSGISAYNHRHHINIIDRLLLQFFRPPLHALNQWHSNKFVYGRCRSIRIYEQKQQTLRLPKLKKLINNWKTFCKRLREFFFQL